MLDIQRLFKSLSQKDVLRITCLFSFSLHNYAADNQVLTVKTIRSLLSGEDDELKSAYDHFHKMVAREKGIMRNAILLGVEHLKVDASAVHADFKEGLAVTQRIDRNSRIFMTGTERIHKHLESKIARIYPFFGIQGHPQIKKLFLNGKTF